MLIVFLICSFLILLAYFIYESRRSRKYTELVIKNIDPLRFKHSYKNYERVYLDQQLCTKCGSNLPDFYYDENYVIVCTCNKCGKEYIAVWK